MIELHNAEEGANDSPIMINPRYISIVRPRDFRASEGPAVVYIAHGTSLPVMLKCRETYPEVVAKLATTAARAGELG